MSAAPAAPCFGRLPPTGADEGLGRPPREARGCRARAWGGAQPRFRLDQAPPEVCEPGPEAPVSQPGGFQADRERELPGRDGSSDSGGGCRKGPEGAKGPGGAGGEGGEPAGEAGIGSVALRGWGRHFLVQPPDPAPGGSREECSGAGQDLGG